MHTVVEKHVHHDVYIHSESGTQKLQSQSEELLSHFDDGIVYLVPGIQTPDKVQVFVVRDVCVVEDGVLYLGNETSDVVRVSQPIVTSGEQRRGNRQLGRVVVWRLTLHRGSRISNLKNDI